MSLLNVSETLPYSQPMTTMRPLSLTNIPDGVEKFPELFPQHGYLKLFIWLLELFLSYRSFFLTHLRLSAFLENLPEICLRLPHMDLRLLLWCGKPH